jgi:hypothetical protein
MLFHHRTVPISVGIIAISFLLAFGRSSILSSFFALLGALFLFPLNVASTWLLIKSGLYALSRKMATNANALKDEENKRTATMKANAMREKMDLREMREIYAAPAREDDDGLRTPRVRGMTSRMGTPRLGGTTRFGAAEFDDDVERGQSSGNGSQVRLMR